MIDHDTLVELLGATNSKTQQKVTARIGTILTLAEPFRKQGSKFTFSANKGLDSNVRKVLVELADDLYESTQTRVNDAIDEQDKEAAWLWVTSSKETQGEIDKYCSHLYFILEGWLAISFVNALDKTRLYTEIITYLDNPYVSQLWKDAFKAGQEYASGIIASGGYHWGKGTPINPIRGLNLVQNDAINSAYHYGTMQVYDRAGAIGYKVHRGSNYDCPICDEACIGIHPLDDMVVPLHPNCVCYTTPVFKTDK